MKYLYSTWNMEMTNTCRSSWLQRVIAKHYIIFHNLYKITMQSFLNLKLMPYIIPVSQTRPIRVIESIFGTFRDLWFDLLFYVQGVRQSTEKTFLLNVPVPVKALTFTLLFFKPNWELFLFVFSLLIFVDNMKRAAVTEKLKVQPLIFLLWTLPGNLQTGWSLLKIKGTTSFKLEKLGYIWLLLNWTKE